MSGIDGRIEAHALALRAFMDQTDKASLPIPFQDFPRGSCGAMSEVAALFLKDRLGVTMTLASGERGQRRDGNWTSHAWLELDGLIVDITADQFGLPPVVVARESPWHAEFHDVERTVLAHAPVWWAHDAAPLWVLLEHLEVSDSDGNHAV